MHSAPLRVAFAGTPEFAACALEAILAAGHEVVLVLTQPDRPAGRGMKLSPSAVKQLALARGIEVDQPEKLRTDAQRARLVACAPVVAAAHEIAAGSAFALRADLALVDQLRDQALCRASRNVGVSREEFCQCQSFDG